MKYSEFWILSNLVEGQRRLDNLSNGLVLEAFNGSSHRLDDDQLADLLAKLFSDGDLVAFDYSDEESDVVGDLVCSRAQIIASFTSGQNLYVGLTPSGGLKWEEISKPNWDVYVSNDWDNEGVWIWRSTNQSAIDEQLRRVDVQAVLVPGSEAWSRISSWSPVYWKTLPSGHELSFQYIGIDKIEDSRLMALPPHGWYTNPYTTT